MMTTVLQLLSLQDERLQQDEAHQRCAWFTEIVLRKVCVYLSIYVPMFVRTHPRE